MIGLRAVFLVAACLWPGLAWAQATGVNPPTGAVWTYLGPTYGAAWMPSSMTAAGGGCSPTTNATIHLWIACPMSGNLPASEMDPTTSPLAQIAITSDTAKSAGAATSALTLTHYFGGAAPNPGCNYPSQCSHFGLWVNLEQTAVTTGVAFDTGIFSNVQIGGPGPGSNVGSIYGYAGQVSDGIGGHYGITGAEFDIALTGTGTKIKEGVGIASTVLGFGNDSQQGTEFSAGLGIWAGGPCGAGSMAGGSGCAGFAIGISFGRSDSYIGVAQAGSLIQTVQGAGTAGNLVTANGISLGNLAVTQNYLNLGGKFAVDAFGTPTVVTSYPQTRWRDLLVSPTAGGLVRLAGAGNGTYSWQINTHPALDFSTAIVALAIDQNGKVTVPGNMSVPLLSGATNQPLCVTATTGALYHGAGGVC